MCVFGARDPESYKLVLKPTSLMRNFEPGVLAPIFRRCSNRYLSEKQEHQHLEGQTTGYGSRTSIQQIYSYKFCKAVAACFQQYLNVRPSDRITSLFVGLIDDLSDRDCSSLLSCLQVNERFIMDFSARIQMKTPMTTNQSKSVHVDHPEFCRMTKAIMRCSSPLELDMNSQDLNNSVMSEITTGCLHFRKFFCPAINSISVLCCTLAVVRTFVFRVRHFSLLYFSGMSPDRIMSLFFLHFPVAIWILVSKVGLSYLSLVFSDSPKERLRIYLYQMKM